MSRLIARFGKLITASFFVMVIGIIVFVLTIPLYTYFEIDTDIIGLIIFITGLAVFAFGIIRRKNLHGWKLVIMIILGVCLWLPLLLLIVTGVYYWITGNPLM